MRALDFADRLLSMADEAAAIRRRASGAHNHRVALLSLREERDALSTLIGRLGVESEETVEALDEARALAQAVSWVLHDRPDVASDLAGHLAGVGELELAAAFGRLADGASALAQNSTVLKGISA